MSDNRDSSKAEPGQGQELKRTHDMSFDATKEDQAGDTDNSDKEDEDSSPEGTVEKAST